MLVTELTVRNLDYPKIIPTADLAQSFGTAAARFVGAGAVIVETSNRQSRGTNAQHWITKLRRKRPCW